MNREINFDNMNTFSEKEIAIFLEGIIEKEMEKETSVINFQLIEESALFLRQLQGKEEYKTTEQFKSEAFQKVTQRYEDIPSSKDKNSSRKGISIKKIIIIAAAVLILSILATTHAVADDPFNFRNKLYLGIHIDDYSNGETKTQGNVTVTRNDNIKYYETLEELIKEENLSGIYFSDDLEIHHMYISKFEDNTDIRIKPVTQTIFFSVTIRAKDEYGLQYNVPTYTKKTLENGIDVWEFDKGEGKENVGRYQLMFKINDWYYCVDTSYPEKGYEVINTFEEVVPQENE